MIETGIVLTVVALLSGVALAPMPWVLNSAAALLAFGFALGVPTGFWYHVALGRALRMHEELPAGWWLRPTSLHGKLQPQDRPQVLRWFYAGGVGFVFTALGCVVLGGAALRLVVGSPN